MFQDNRLIYAAAAVVVVLVTGYEAVGLAEANRNQLSKRKQRTKSTLADTNAGRD